MSFTVNFCNNAFENNKVIITLIVKYCYQVGQGKVWNMTVIDWLILIEICWCSIVY